ncbi:MAG: hypothetical protein DRJ33_08200 [Candidatus Methanomethylicota archaeon]|uniref:Uncharacterized protein n=1 Tax=Thermoproteota archaeon TaxID=2056631 RepID=A0A497EQ85_9CREN|nr:MAG: hypothetical protein DRJ33_08200 [Candidatus Verstraetearchaeota archaeon]
MFNYRNAVYILVFYAAFAVTLAILSVFKIDLSMISGFLMSPIGAVSTMILATVVIAIGALMVVKTDYTMVGYALATFGIILSLTSLMVIITFIGHLAQLLWPPRFLS